MSEVYKILVGGKVREFDLNATYDIECDDIECSDCELCGIRKDLKLANCGQLTEKWMIRHLIIENE